MFNFLKFNITKNTGIKDISFSNLFWKKFVIRLIVLFIVSIFAIHACQAIVIDICKRDVNNAVFETTLYLSQLEDKEMSKDRLTTTANVLLAKSQSAINENPFVADASLSFYNLSRGELIAKSFSVPVINSEEAIEWWRQQSGIEEGPPIISISDDAIKFYNKHPDDTIYIEKMYCINSVIFPSSLIAKDNRGKIVDSFNALTPSTSVGKEFTKSVELEMIGNSDDDAIYKIMESFSIKSKEQNESFLDGTQNKIIVVSYDDMSNNKNVQLLTKSFTINNNDYQIDCGYQVNFWIGAWQYVVVAEIVCILLCAISALINTKETLALCD